MSDIHSTIPDSKSQSMLSTMFPQHMHGTPFETSCRSVVVCMFCSATMTVLELHPLSTLHPTHHSPQIHATIVFVAVQMLMGKVHSSTAGGSSGGVVEMAIWKHYCALHAGKCYLIPCTLRRQMLLTKVRHPPTHPPPGPQADAVFHRGRCVRAWVTSCQLSTDTKISYCYCLKKEC